MGRDIMHIWSRLYGVETATAQGATTATAQGPITVTMGITAEATAQGTTTTATAQGETTATTRTSQSRQAEWVAPWGMVRDYFHGAGMVCPECRNVTLRHGDGSGGVDGVDGSGRVDGSGDDGSGGVGGVAGNGAAESSGHVSEVVASSRRECNRERSRSRSRM